MYLAWQLDPADARLRLAPLNSGVGPNNMMSALSSRIGGLSAGKRIAMATIAGVIIAAVDNYAFGGEVSPIVIVGMLLVATGAAGYFWGIRGAPAAAIVWVFVPSVHLVNLALGLPDSLQPHTYGSALKLGAFTAVVGILGTAGGAAIGRLSKPVTHRPRGQA